MGGADGGEGNLFVEMLKRRRKAMKMRQEDLAEAAGVSRFSVMRWESGEVLPDPSQIVPVARALQVDPADVFRSVGWLPLDEEQHPLPELPPELERLAALLAQADKKDAAELIERVAWVIEWYENRVTARKRQPRSRRAG